MNDLHVFFVDEGLETHRELFNDFQKMAPFATHWIPSRTLLTADFWQSFKQTSAENIFFVVHFDYYQSQEATFNDRLRLLFPAIFAHMIFINPTADFLLDAQVKEGSKHFFVMSESQLLAQMMNFVGLIQTMSHDVLNEKRLTDYIVSSFQDVVSTELLQLKNKEIENLNAELNRLNRIDTLTNLFNRNALYEILEGERRRTVRDHWRITHTDQIINKPPLVRGETDYQHTPEGSLYDHFGVFSLFMIDIDHFKHVNDTWGHLMGDKVLAMLGQLFSTSGVLRTTDVAARFGGEEFIVILPETNANNALLPAQRLCELFRNISFEAPENQGIFHVTLSIGISEFHLDDKSNDDIIQRADKALYHSKNNGRDQITIYEQQFTA